MIYLDHAATTPVPRPVADAMYQVLTEQFGNPSSQYPLGREAKAGGTSSPTPWSTAPCWSRVSCCSSRGTR